MSSVYILPTRSWFVLGAVLVAMWYAAVSQSNSAAYLLMFFLGSLAVVSAYHAHFALTGLTLAVSRVAPVFAGENARVPVEIGNTTSRARPALAVAPNGRVFKETSHVAAETVPSYASCFVDLPLPAPARGRRTVGRVAVTTNYPLGFFRSWRYGKIDTEFLVYPTPAGSLPLPIEAAPVSESSVAGGRSVNHAGDDYAGVRNYQPGESQRHVDWRAVARGQALLVKQFSGTGSRRLWLDYGQTFSVGDVEARLSQLCRWVVDAEKGAFTYGLRVGNFTAEPSHGTAHYHHCLEALATAFTEPEDAAKPINP